ncbi:cytochrome P450, partial [Rhizoclosmatium globosum]
GHLADLIGAEPLSHQRKWIAELGPIVRFHRILNEPAVLVASPSALRHILATNAQNYSKDVQLFKIIGAVLGPGLLTVSGDVHSRQRHIIAPSFRHKNLIHLIPTFIASARELRAAFLENLSDAPNQTMEINVLEEMSKPTLDIIGRAGFGYEFNAVSNSEATSALYAHFSAVTDLFPFVKYFVRAEWETHLNVVQSKKALEKACREMVEARLKESLSGDGENDVGDLLSVFLKANREIKDVQSRLSDEELGAQVLTFLLAGHETTSVALTWTLDFLSKNPEIQVKLREELKLDMAHSDADPSLDLITSSGNYLDAVFKESLRLATPAPMTMRKCLNDDVLDGFKIPKGTTISISPDIMHKLPDIWGPDVLDFKPERWLDIGKQEEDDPRRTFGSFMPFMLGPRNCIGAKFATYEYKAILAVLVRNFEF